MNQNVHIINGPNLNLLGSREPGVYGTATLDDIEAQCAARLDAYGLKMTFFQSNAEGAIVDMIQAAGRSACGIVLNAAAYSHTSIAILDALQNINIPVIEVHLSNIFAREDFRYHSYVSAAATGVICGLGAHGYELAIDALARQLKQ